MIEYQKLGIYDQIAGAHIGHKKQIVTLMYRFKVFLKTYAYLLSYIHIGYKNIPSPRV